MLDKDKEKAVDGIVDLVFDPTRARVREMMNVALLRVMSAAAVITFCIAVVWGLAELS